MAFAPKGAYNRAPVFNGDHFDYWKSSMRIHINSFDSEVWNAIENGPFAPTITDAHGVVANKPMAQWTDEEKKKVNYDAKAQNILISSLGIDQFYHVSHCESAKEMWDTLVTHFEGTNDVKISKINTLTQEFELFHMLDGESIEDMQQRFIKITNKLHGLGKPISNQDATNKILRCLSRNWQPKVTAIKEANDLTSLNLTTLFGKLTEHEHVLNLLEKHEKSEKKVKHNDKEKEKDKRSIALKASTSKSTKSKKVEQNDSSLSDEEWEEYEMEMFLRRFYKYAKVHGIKFSKENGPKSRKQSRDDIENEKSKPSRKCYECGKSDHLKPECPFYNKRKGKSSEKNHKGKRAYVAWDSASEDGSRSKSSSEEDEERAHVVLMTGSPSKGKKHHKRQVSDSSSISNDSPSYDELQNAFEKLYGEATNAFKKLAKRKKVISLLESQIVKLQDELEALKLTMVNSKDEFEDDNSSKHDCDSCCIWQGEVKNLQAKLDKAHKSSRNDCDACCVWQGEVKTLQAKLDEALVSKVTFVDIPKNFNKPKIRPSKNDKFVKKKLNPKSKISGHKNHSNTICHYCCNKGHTIAKCHARKTLVPKGILQWLPKLGNNVVTNKLGPNMSWGPISNV